MLRQADGTVGTGPTIAIDAPPGGTNDAGVLVVACNLADRTQRVRVPRNGTLLESSDPHVEIAGDQAILPPESVAVVSR